MSTSPSDIRKVTRAATLGAAAMIAHQTAGKATRDAFFLSEHAIDWLPLMVIAAAVLSIAVALGMSRALSRHGPARLVPAVFTGSAIFTVIEWLAAPAAPKAIAVVFYLHMASFGAVLISNFWSLLNERFDPHTAKRQIGRIGAGAALGGLIGGLLAERVAAYFTLFDVLPLLTLLHLAAAVTAHRLALPAPRRREATTTDVERIESGIGVVRQVPYLRQLSLLVLLGTLSAGFLDFVFKARAAAAYGEREEMLRFFAVFYTAIAVLTFVLQSFGSRRSLERLGLAKTVAWLPGASALGALGGLIVPGLPAVAVGRGAEAVVRSSLYRSAYEILFTPIAPREKRASKTLVDVGVERVGDALSGGVVKLAIWVVPALANSILLVLAGITALLSLWLTRQLHRGYVRALEDSLLTRAADLDLAGVSDSTTRSTVLQTLGTLDLDQAMRALSMPGVGLADRAHGLLLPRAAEREAATASGSAPAAAPVDALLAQIASLRSGDAERVREVLKDAALQPALVPHVIPLLAWDAVSADAVAALRRLAPRVTGQLVDALLDEEEEFSVRRRLPRVLAWAGNQRAAEGLLTGLADRRFEVRFQSGRALAYLMERVPELTVAPAAVYERIAREAEVDRRVWESHRLLDRPDEDEGSPFSDDLLRERASRGLEHVFTLLSLVLPRQPLSVAFRGLHTSDPGLRGTALEYLESVLPGQLRERLWPLLQGDGASREPAPRGDALDRLMRSDRTIRLNLESLRGKS